MIATRQLTTRIRLSVCCFERAYLSAVQVDAKALRRRVQ